MASLVNGRCYGPVTLHMDCGAVIHLKWCDVLKWVSEDPGVVRITDRRTGAVLYEKRA